MLNIRSIRTQLFSILGLLILGGAFASAVAYLISETGRASLETVYADRVVPLRDLKGVSDEWAVYIVDNAHKVRSGAVSFEEGLRNMDAALENSDSLYAAYMKTRMDENERQLAQAAQAEMEARRASVLRLRDILLRGDQAGLETYIANDLYPTIDPVTGSLDKLVKLQVSEAKESYDHAVTTSTALLTGLVVVFLINAALGVGGFVIVRRRILKPVNDLTRAMMRLADRDYTVDVPSRTSTSEIGDMARAVEVFKTNGVERERLEMAEQAAVAEREARAQRIDALVRAFDASTTEIVTVVTSAAHELEVSAETLTQGAEETSRQSIIVSAASEEASMNVQTVAAATEEMSASVQEIARQVQGSVSVAGEAVSEATRTAEIVGRLSEGAQRIGDIVNLITSVAAQTNLLALNATIEAARAGEAGKGFAVVAGEVKSLAQQTAKASADIEAQVRNIQTITRDAVNAIDLITSTIENMSGITTAISAAVEEQHATTQEIARNVQEASSGTVEVTRNVQGISRATEETSAAATQVLGASSELSEQSSNLRRQVQDFISQIKAA